MFLRRYVRTKAGKQHAYFALVESVRTEAGPRQHVVAYLGELNADQESRRAGTGNAPSSSTTARAMPSNCACFPMTTPCRCPTIPMSFACASRRSAGPMPVASAMSFSAAGSGTCSISTPSSTGTSHRARKQFGPSRRAGIVAIEVINRLCAPCSEFALAEHWYASTGLEDLLGVPDEAVTKDRLYRTLDRLLQAKVGIENDLKARFEGLFQLEYDLLLYDLTSSYFEGLAEENDLAKRGYSRDHRSDCKQIVLALVVTREGFPLAHETLVGNTKDVQTVRRIVGAIEERFGKSQRVWVMDRGMISADTLAFLEEPGRRYLLATRRDELKHFQDELLPAGWQQMPNHPGVVVKLLKRDAVHYLLARSNDRKQKERAIRRKQRRSLALALRKLQVRVAKGRLKQRDKVLEAIGRLKGRFPKAVPFVIVAVTTAPLSVVVQWQIAKFKDALRRDGAYLLRSNQGGWTAEVFWETYTQLTTVERAFRVLKSELLLRPIWHQYSGRTQAHVFVCVLAYALWKTLDHLAKRAKLQTLIHKPDRARGNAVPKPRPMTPEVILRELGRILIGDIELPTTDGRRLIFRRVARPDPEQKRILQALGIDLPERLSPDRVL